MSKKEAIILTAILLYSLIVRIMLMSQFDMGAHWDEGYFFASSISGTQSIKEFFFPTLFDVEEKRMLFYFVPGQAWINSVPILAFGINNLTIRLSSIIIGSLSVIIFYQIIKLLFSKKEALVSAMVLASLPLHVAFSRLSTAHISELFYFLIVMYFFILFNKTKKSKFLYLSIIPLSLMFISRLWGALTYLAALSIWTVISASEGRKRLLLKVMLVFLIAALPCIIYIVQFSNYYNSNEEFLVIPTKYDYQMNLQTFFKEINEEYYKFETISLKRLNMGYYKQGNLSTDYLFSGLNITYALLIIIGGIITLHQILLNPEKEEKKKHLIWILWLIAFIPIQFTSRKPMHLLVILTPVMAFFICQSTVKISRILRKPAIQKTFMAVILLFFLIAPIRMILTQNEVLYQTHFEAMGQYVANYREEYKYSAISSSTVCFSAYAGKYAFPIQLLNDNKTAADFIERNETRFIEMNAEMMEMQDADEYNWIISNCININDKIGVDESAPNRLYDCKK